MVELEEFVVPALLGGVRLDRVLSMTLDVSRSQARSMAISGLVKVEGTVVTTPRYLVQLGDHIAAQLDRVVTTRVKPNPTVHFLVHYEDEDFVVIEKPWDLVVHPGAGQKEGTLVAGLLHRYPDLASTEGIGAGFRPGIVHRLDKGTSGLVVVARSAQAYESFVTQLSSHSMSRTYLALVDGVVEAEEGIVDGPIGRSPKTPTKMAVVFDGRDARTKYRVIRRLENQTLVYVALETGRTHQIRVHMSAIDHPVVGDMRYGKTSLVSDHEIAKALPEGRLFLHAYQLRFSHPKDGKEMTFRSTAPDDLVEALGEPIVLS